MYELERDIGADTHGVARRCALTVLTETGAHLMDSITEDRETAVVFAEIDGSIATYVKSLKWLLTAMEHANVRVMLSLAARPDMQAVIAEAKSGNGAEAATSWKRPAICGRFRRPRLARSDPFFVRQTVNLRVRNAFFEQLQA